MELSLSHVAGLKPPGSSPLSLESLAVSSIGHLGRHTAHLDRHFPLTTSFINGQGSGPLYGDLGPTLIC